MWEAVVARQCLLLAIVDDATVVVEGVLLRDECCCEMNQHEKSMEDDGCMTLTDICLARSLNLELHEK